MEKYNSNINEYEGRVQLLAKDFTNNNIDYYLYLNGRRYKLLLKNENVKLKISKYKPNEIIKIKGIKKGESIVVIDVLD